MLKIKTGEKHARNRKERYNYHTNLFLHTEVGSETESNVDSEFGRTHFDDLVPSPTSEKAFLAQIHARKPGYLHNVAATGTIRSDLWVLHPVLPSL